MYIYKVCVHVCMETERVCVFVCVYMYIHVTAGGDYSKTDARFMQDAPKAVWNIPYVSGIFPRFNCDNPALVGCIPIAAVAVNLN